MALAPVLMKVEGALVADKDAERDGNIATANGPRSPNNLVKQLFSHSVYNWKYEQRLTNTLMDSNHINWIVEQGIEYDLAGRVNP